MSCPRGMQPRHHQVTLTDHAWRRYLERSKIELGPGSHRRARERLAWLISYKLNEAIAAGLYIDHTGAGWVEIEPELWAVVCLEPKGWMVMTALNWSKKTGEAG